jgi:1-deoxy-D-xylulose-5-phosphate synthase
MSLLETIGSPADLRRLSPQELERLSAEIRGFIVDKVTRLGGHLGSNLGAVELTIALHRAFDSPRDILLWDTGHQAYVHKLVTGRQGEFDSLRQEDGLSGYPNRTESEHDWVENSHASTILSYAHGIATALEHSGEASSRRVVAVVGDGAMTGGMAFEGLNNLGHSGKRVVIVLNDNGRSYAPTVSRLSTSISMLRLNPSYRSLRRKVERALAELGRMGRLADAGLNALTTAIREAAADPVPFFEALGVRYTGPFDGHDIAEMEEALRGAADHPGPIVVHVRTEKGHGYQPAVDDEEQCLHDFKVVSPSAQVDTPAPATWTQSFTKALLGAAEADDKVVAITAAMPGPTGLLPFQARFPDRFFDVGIAEQHAITAAAGMAMGGLKPVVAVYSTFFSRAFDQANLDVGLHGLPVVFALDRAGITGDDGPSHHGVLDLALTLAIPGMTVLTPSSSEELEVMLPTALAAPGPTVVRWPKGEAHHTPDGEVGEGLKGRKIRTGADACILAVGRMLGPSLEAAEELASRGIEVTVWDVRVVKPLDDRMLADAVRHPLVVTVEDGVRVGGAGSHIDAALARLDETRPPVVNLGTPLEYISQAKPHSILARLGLDGPGIAASTEKAIQANRR